MSSHLEIETKSGERVVLERRGVCASFKQLAALLGFHNYKKVQGSLLIGENARARVQLVRTGFNAWTLQSSGSPDYTGIVAQGLPLHEGLLRLDRLEQRIWRDCETDGSHRFKQVNSDTFLPPQTGLNEMANKIGLVLPN